MLRRIINILVSSLLVALSCQRGPVPSAEWKPVFVSTEALVNDNYVAMTAVLESGLSEDFEYGFYYGTTGVAQIKVAARFRDNCMMAEVSSLEYDCAYVFKAYISNGRNEVCSAENEFVTGPQPQTPSQPVEPPVVEPEDPVAPPADDPSTEPEIPPTDDPVTPPVVDPEEPTVELIDFADATMKSACVAAFDRDNDGELSVEEAADVRDLASLNLKGLYVTSFDEFRYFTSVETVPYECFMGQPLNSIVFPSGLKTICESAFAECIGLTAVEIPSGVREIGNSAFNGCSNIRSVTLPQTVGTIGEHAFRSCHHLEAINLPESLTVLNKWVFYQCSSLSRITLPENLRIIHDGALSSCYSLQEVTVPSGVLSIGFDAFADCPALADVYMLPADPPLMGTTVFNDNSPNLKIHVPASSYDRYLSGTGWESYAQYLVFWEF